MSCFHRPRWASLPRRSFINVIQQLYPPLAELAATWELPGWFAALNCRVHGYATSQDGPKLRRRNGVESNGIKSRVARVLWALPFAKPAGLDDQSHRVTLFVQPGSTNPTWIRMVSHMMTACVTLEVGKST